MKRGGDESSRGHRLDVDRVSVGYGGAMIVDSVSLAVEPGELVALLGPSGCGKTTLLRAVAGFLRPAGGRILFDGKPVDHLPPGERRVGIVFQNYALFPHMSVAENVAYGLRARGVNRRETAERVAAALAAVQMEQFAGRRPRQLSGGQQQRVSLARAIVTEPAVLLLDEPFAALDRALRLDLQLEIKRLQRRLGLTALMVTHDQDEAMSMADRMAVMRAGRLEQLDTPSAVYDAPATRFVAGFVGASVEMPGRVSEVSGEQCRVTLDAGAQILVPRDPRIGRDSRVVVATRPEHLALFDQPAADRIAAELRQSAPIAGTLVHDVSAGGLAIKVTEPRRGAARAPGAVFIGLVPAARPALFALNDAIPGGSA
jgi:putative spermidine/putrescine transport system ATP-binding protein